MTNYQKYRMNRAKRMWKKILGWIALPLIAYMIADIGGYLAWEWTGQTPSLGWYFGSITQFIINLI